jgi:formylglycine-generating enzyme required for sulfatase activity/uncharacterized caspase-like protein
MAKVALLIGISAYDENSVPNLPAVEGDLVAMRQVLENPQIADFDRVAILPNPQRQEMADAIERLFSEGQPDDLIVLYFSGHGVKDGNENLYLTSANTRENQGRFSKASAIEARFIHDQMESSRCNRQVIILDCCFSGAFAEGLSAKAFATEPIAEALKAQLGVGAIVEQPQSKGIASRSGNTGALGLEGRAILTSSTDSQPSFEESGSQISVYTRHLVEGLKTGAADSNGDGVILIEELHEYAKERVQKAFPGMKPEIYAVREGYKIRLAQARIDDPELEYRKEVKRSLHDGQITGTGRRILQRRRSELGLTSEVAMAIEAAVLQPYQEYFENLKEFREALAEDLKAGAGGLNQAAYEQLRRFQQVLQLRDEDVARAIGQVVPGRQALTDLIKMPVAPPISASAPTVRQLSTPTPPRTKRVMPKPVGFDRDRRKVLQWLGYGGGAAALAVVGKAVFDGGRSSTPSPSISPTNTLPPALEDFSFEVATVDKQGQESPRKTMKAKHFVENNLGNGVTLQMVSIPGGTFQMGSPSTEEWRSDDESPQHSVNVSAFSIGRYAVTQAQYEAIMGKNPSNFKGAKRPVESVSWNDAQEFCKKLSQRAGRKYRLPSEAEWEYACRARTTTPFHFGDTMTSALANYRATSTYQSEPKGEHRKQTTDVGIFPANAFGLCDMHGSVWEWCEDTYHKNYEGAPTDGSAWNVAGDVNGRVLRGGSWFNLPRSCRSATRNLDDAGFRNGSIGFRVVCSSVRA